MSNWYVITGGPSSGKTTRVNLLRQRGYRTTIEHARHYLVLQRVGGRSVADIRSRQLEFQRGVLTMQLEQEAALDPDEVVFLDRALPDSLAYYRFLDLPPLTKDYARTEDSAAQDRIRQLLFETYDSLHVALDRVPVLAPDDRVDFILARL